MRMWCLLVKMMCIYQPCLYRIRWLHEDYSLLWMESIMISYICSVVTHISYSAVTDDNLLYSSYSCSPNVSMYVLLLPSSHTLPVSRPNLTYVQRMHVAPDFCRHRPTAQCLATAYRQLGFISPSHIRDNHALW